jgi:hypothetical protein
MASLITLNSSNASTTNTNVFQFTFPSGSVKFRNATVAVQSIIIPYSWLNLNAAAYNNTQLQITMPVTIGGSSIQQTISLTIPNGFYTLANLNSYLQAQMISLGYYLIDANGSNVYYLELVSNTNLDNCQLNVYPVPTTKPVLWSYGATGTWGAAGVGSLPTTPNQVPQLITLSNNFGSLIGFAANSTFPSSTTSASIVSTTSTLVPQITPVTSLYVGCDLTRNLYANPTNILCNVALTSEYATNIIYTPYEMVDLPVLEGNINGFTVVFYDQSFNPLPIIDTNLTVNLLLRFNKNTELNYNK